MSFDLVEVVYKCLFSFNAFKQESHNKIKTMAKADRRQKMEMEKMKRQQERVENRLRIKSQQAQLAEKKLKEMMAKKQNAQVKL